MCTVYTLYWSTVPWDDGAPSGHGRRSHGMRTLVITENVTLDGAIEMLDARSFGSGVDCAAHQPA